MNAYITPIDMERTDTPPNSFSIETWCQKMSIPRIKYSGDYCVVSVLETACGTPGSIQALDWLLHNEKASNALIAKLEKDGDDNSSECKCLSAYTAAIRANNIKAIRWLSEQMHNHHNVIAERILTSHHVSYKIHPKEVQEEGEKEAEEEKEQQDTELPLRLRFELNLPILTAALHSTLATFKLVLSLEPKSINFASATFGESDNYCYYYPTLFIYGAQNENPSILRFLLSKRFLARFRFDIKKFKPTFMYDVVVRSSSEGSNKSIAHHLCQMSNATKRFEILYQFCSSWSETIYDPDYNVFNSLDSEGLSPFLFSVKIGNLDAAKWLHDKFPEQSPLVILPELPTNRHEQCATILAMEYGHCHILDWLNSETECDMNGKRIVRALNKASMRNDLAVVKWFVDQGLYIPSGESDLSYFPITPGKTPFTKAFQHGHLEMVKYLYSVGAKLSERVWTGDTSTSTILHYAIGYNSSDEMLEWVGEVTNYDLTLVLGDKVREDFESEDVLSVACRSQLLERVQWLTSPRIKLPLRSFSRGSPIVKACSSGNIEIVKHLLLNCYNDHGHWVNHPDCQAIHVAAENGHIAILKLLVEHGIPVDKPDWLGRTPSYRALVLNSNPEPVLKWLLRNGADFSKRSPTRGDTTIIARGVEYSHFLRKLLGIAD